MKITLVISNMNCANCISTIENSLNNLNGINEVSCNLIAQTCFISYQEDLISYDKIIKTLNEIGYQVQEQLVHQELLVSNIHCANCILSIEQGLSKELGISKVNANLLTSRVSFDYNENLINEATIIEKLKELGYPIINKIISVQYEFTHLEDGDDLWLKNYLSNLEGLSNLVFNQNKLSFNYDDKLIDIIELKALIRSKNYQLKRIDQEVVDIQTLNKKLFFNKFILALFFSVILMFISMSDLIGLNLAMMVNPFSLAIIQLLLCLIVLLIGRNFYISGFRALIKLHPNMDTLIALGSGVGFGFSIFNMFNIKDDMILMDHLYFESSAMIITFILLGKYLEAKSKKNAAKALRELYDLVPAQVLIKKDQDEILIDNEELKVNDIVSIKPGHIIVGDGIIIEGIGELDESIISGESLPITKKEDDLVKMGSINTNGYFKYRVSDIGEQTSLAKIIKLVNDAQSSKTPIAKLADQVSKYFVLIIIGLALVSGLFWLVIMHENIDFVIRIICTVLIIACPCALGLATPTAMMVASNLAAKQGILVKEMAALEMANQVDVIAFDKTGTITNGNLEVIKVNYHDENYQFYHNLLISMEMKSEHLIAQAITKHFLDNDFEELLVEDYENIISKGLKACYNNKIILVGNDKFMDDHNISIPQSYLEEDQTLKSSHISIYLSYDSIIMMQLIISDTIKDNASLVVNQLKYLNKELVILSGDATSNTQIIASQVGIDHYYGNLSPQNKIEYLKGLRNKNLKVMMVGDGINDAPALAEADLAVAIGAGTNVAIDCADVILVNNDLLDIVKLITLSHKTIINIKQNLFWAFAYNVIMIPIAMGLFYHLNGLLINPMFGALAMSLSSLTVLSNSLRLYKINFKEVLKNE
ncbi:MAG: heavy metal translocating P-type ATPase [Bacilli bacterium]|jgi:Cu+-exporting ATPase|nr:heavy metal translocating P-type ATPase [Bacilli bacterium]